MEITLDQIKELRNRTGVGISECKKALTEAGGDIDKAIEILRKKGASMATKRAHKAANEGAIKAKISSDKKKGAIIEINCETDFVAKGDGFQKLAEDIAKAVLESKLSEETGDVDLILSLKMDDKLSVKDHINSMMGSVGEKVELKRADIVKIEDGFVSEYVHFGSKLGSLVGLKGELTEDSERLGKNLAMQVVAMNPQAIDRDGISKETIDMERDIYLTAAKNDNKPEDIAKKIAENKLERYFQDHVLLEQEYINEAGKSVKNLIGEFNKNTGNNIEIKKIIRYQLGGEG